MKNCKNGPKPWFCITLAYTDPSREICLRRPPLGGNIGRGGIRLDGSVRVPWVKCDARCFAFIVAVLHQQKIHPPKQRANCLATFIPFSRMSPCPLSPCLPPGWSSTCSRPFGLGPSQLCSLQSNPETSLNLTVPRTASCLCVHRPENPIDYVAAYLLAHNPNKKAPPDQ